MCKHPKSYLNYSLKQDDFMCRFYSFMLLLLGGLYQLSVVAYGYAPGDDIMDRSPTLPKFFWMDARSAETGRPDVICEVLGCDGSFEERYRSTLSYLRKHVDRLWSERSH